MYQLNLHTSSTIFALLYLTKYLTNLTPSVGQRQPDNREKIHQGGEDEACLAVLNNFYGDGIKWHDVACHHEKPIICEDTEGHLNFARQTFPNLQIN